MSENIIEKGAIDAVNEQYYVYGEYVNLHRHIPYLFDGLKPSYRRVIQAAFDVAKDKLAKTATIVGRTIGAYHPHGDQSVGPIVSELVHAGIFTGKGNHGAELILSSDLPPAAVRYTEARLSDNYKKLLSPLLPEVPTFKNEFGIDEYEYLPTPIPLGLLFGYLGIGIGTNCRVPAFTPESILDAYLNDDYHLLKDSDGVEITNYDDKYDSNNELIKIGGIKRLWNEGYGRVGYRMNFNTDGTTIVIKGSKGPLKLNWDWILAQKLDGRVEANELTSTEPYVEIYKTPRVQYPSYEEIEDNVKNIIQGYVSYLLKVVFNNQVRIISLYDWIDITYKNYKKLYKNYINRQVDNLKWDIELFTHFREIADLIINKTDSYDEIAKSLNLPRELIDAVGKKSINTLRTADPKYKIPELESKINELENFDIDLLIKNNITLM